MKTKMPLGFKVWNPIMTVHPKLLAKYTLQCQLVRRLKPALMPLLQAGALLRKKPLRTIREFRVEGHLLAGP